ncbi:hypothetical protein [Uliginosibacterium sediminicola]|uniref:Uncharacterized protein n=1 Tax=Uliginosibacterium sediminicola TaxID=2024550 RepID=A0ABU9Z0Z9_9RHOO
MKVLLEEFNLVRYAIEFDTDSLASRRIERSELPPDAFSWSNENSPIDGCFADIGNERVYLYGVPSDSPNVYGRPYRELFQASSGDKIEIKPGLRCEFEPRIDLPSGNGERWIEFRLLDHDSGQLRYKAIYDAAPILYGYWNDFTFPIEYKDWDFYAQLKDFVDQDQLAAERVAQGLPPSPYGNADEVPEEEPAPVPELPFELPPRAESEALCPRSGMWGVVGDLNARQRIEEGSPIPLHQGLKVDWVWLER